MITLVIVDDHALVREGVQTFLRTQPDMHIVGAVATGAEAVALVSAHVPDVALVDLVMPTMDGVETTRRIKQISPHTQVIILTSFSDDQYVFPALRAGALSYLLKDVDADSLADAIRRAVSGEALLAPNVAARVVRELRGGAGDHDPLTDLTEREMDVLRLLAQGQSNAEIADALVISVKTVKVHVSNILSKLHLADRTRAAVYALQKGVR